MAYKVINDFYDAENNNEHYVKDDVYPKGDFKPSKKRLETLTGIHPEHNKAFIEEVAEEENPEEKKPTKDKKTKNKE